MDFLSFSFPILFVATMVLYYSSRTARSQNIVLTISSFLFYGWIHPWFCALLLLSTIVDFFCGQKMPHSRNPRAYLVVSLLTNLGVLGVFKYFNFFSQNFSSFLSSLGIQTDPLILGIILPVGISFYTFQTLSYSIDIYYERIKPADDFFTFSAFVSMFPQLVAGPIERAKNMLPQLTVRRKFDIESIGSAIPLISVGYFKKVVVADNLATYVDRIFSLQAPSALLIATGSFLFAIQILCDFSGYTDIARGFARMLNLNLMKNFNFPYLAVSPSDFWRRWHISLSTWFRDYVYIPLGGSKSSRHKFIFAVLVTMILSGLWHGAAWNFLLWGAYHGLLLIFYSILGFKGHWQPKSISGKVTSILVMFLFTLVGWTIFRADISWLSNAAYNFTLISKAHDLITAPYLVVYSFFLCFPLILFYIYPPRFRNSFATGAYSGLLLLLALSSFNPIRPSFIYFQF